VLLCANFQRGVWALPKGTPDPGENIVETAQREVREETGLEVEMKAKAGSINYWFVHEGIRCRKTVHFFLMEPRGGSLEKHDPEFDAVEWVSLTEAYQRMSYKNETEMVRRAVALFCGESSMRGCHRHHKACKWPDLCHAPQAGLLLPQGEILRLRLRMTFSGGVVAIQC
jgi:8-oxo-dGTP pyrophosphatase MutT (NUDIX family)